MRYYVRSNRRSYCPENITSVQRVEKMSNPIHVLFKRRLSEVQHKDVGLVLILVLLFLYQHYDYRSFLVAVFVVAGITLLLPVVLHPISKVWYALSELLGTVMSRVLLTIVFFLIITPIGFIKRTIDGKRLLGEKWKKGTSTVFINKNKKITQSDIGNTF